jgi:hypothetical protein
MLIELKNRLRTDFASPQWHPPKRETSAQLAVKLAVQLAGQREPCGISQGNAAKDTIKIDS